MDKNFNVTLSKTLWEEFKNTGKMTVWCKLTDEREISLEIPVNKNYTTSEKGENITITFTGTQYARYKVNSGSIVTGQVYELTGMSNFFLILFIF